MFDLATFDLGNLFNFENLMIDLTFRNLEKSILIYRHFNYFCLNRLLTVVSVEAYKCFVRTQSRCFQLNLQALPLSLFLSPSFPSFAGRHTPRKQQQANCVEKDVDFPKDGVRFFGSGIYWGLGGGHTQTRRRGWI